MSRGVLLVLAGLGGLAWPACSTRVGTLLVVTVGADQPVTIDELSATIIAGPAKTMRTFDHIPVVVGTIPPNLTFGVDIPPDITGEIEVTVTAGAATASDKVTAAPGREVDLTLTFTGGADLGVADLADLGDLTPPPLDLLNLDLTPPPGCGDGTREGLEGCDDGNNTDGDGCNSLCVIESTRLPVFADIGSSAAAWMTVDPAGTLFIKLSGGCTSVDTIYSVNPAGTLSMAGVPGVLPKCGGSVLAIGGSLMFGGSTTTTTYVQHHDTSSMSPPLATLGTAKWSSFAASDVSIARLFFSTYTSPVAGGGDMSDKLGTYRVGGNAIFAKYSDTECDRLLYQHKVDPMTDALLCASGHRVLSADPRVDAGVYSTVFQTPASTGSIVDLAVDAEGTIYGACSVLPAGPGPGSSQPCAAGSILAYNPALAPGVVTFVDPSAGARALAYDPSANDLVLLSGTAVKRVHLTR